jgi:hypothetical protein
MKSAILPAKTTEPAKPYEPTAGERIALEAHRDRRLKRRPAPSLKVSSHAERLEWEAGVAIDYAIASVEQAKLAMLDAISSRVEAEKTKASHPAS